MKSIIAIVSSLLVVLVLSLFALTTSASSVDSLVRVHPEDMVTGFPGLSSNPNSWFFFNDENNQIDNTLGSFVFGPATAPFGSDSIQISVTGSQRRNLATYQFRGTKLEDITVLRYSTYNPSSGNGGGVNRSGYLHFNVDFNGTDTWQRRLVFVPSNNGLVIQNSWQEWDAIQSGNAKWSYSGATWPLTTVGPDAGQTESGSTLRSWADILADYPGVRVRLSDSFMGIRVGEPYSNGYTENIDGFKFGTLNGVTTFDFERFTTPTSKEECKNDGWKVFNNPTFKNQGDCVSFLSSNDKAEGNKSK